MNRASFAAILAALAFTPFVAAQTTEPAASQPAADQNLVRPSADVSGDDAEKYRLVSRPDEVISVLENGATVIAKRVPSPVIAVRAHIHTGSVYEGKWLGGGLSHLLEHLVAGGSNARRTEAENKSLLQKIGNNSNAFTKFNETVFFVTTTPPHLDQAVDLVTGWVTGASITPAEYRREYQVVQRELEMGKGQPDRQFFYLTYANRYHQSPARVPLIGYQEVIQGLSRDDVYSYYKQAYVPQNMVFSVAGDLDPEQMIASVRRNLADVKPGREFDHAITPETPVDAPRTLVATFPKLGESRLQLGFPIVRLGADDMYPLDLLSVILGAGESSVLTQKLRDEQGLVSGIGAGDDTPEYVDGTFAIDMQLAAQNIRPATDAALAVLEDVKQHGVDAEQLARAKTQLRVSRVAGTQTADAIAESLADDFITTGDPHFSDRYVDRIGNVTSEQIQEVARRYLDRRKLLTTVLLPDDAAPQGLPSAAALLRDDALAATQQGSPAATRPATVARSVLPDGTVLLVKPMSSSPLVSIRMFATGGVSAEDAGNNGIGNLTLAMLPRGTATRSAKDIAEAIDNMGSSLGTASGTNTFQWSATTLTDNFDRTFALFADVVTHPIFPADELAQMKPRLDAAIDSQDSDWNAEAFRFFKQQYFGPKNEPYQFLPLGTKANVDKFTADQLKQWYEQKVLTSPRVLAVYGDVDPAKVQAMAAQALATLPKVEAKPSRQGPSTDDSANLSPPATPAVDVERVEVKQTRKALAGIVIGYDSESIYGEPRQPAIELGQTLCAGFGYPTGYLFETLRGQGLVYVVAAMNSPGPIKNLPGTFMAYAGCGPKNVTTVVDQMLLNIARLQGSDADIEGGNPAGTGGLWFDRAKQLMDIGQAMQGETPAAQAETAAIDELYGVGYDYREKFAERIDPLTIAEVRDAASRRLRKCVVTICTPDPASVNVKPGVRTYAAFPSVDLTPRGVQHDMPTGAK